MNLSNDGGSTLTEIPMTTSFPRVLVGLALVGAITLQERPLPEKSVSDLLAPGHSSARVHVSNDGRRTYYRLGKSFDWWLYDRDTKVSARVVTGGTGPSISPTRDAIAVIREPNVPMAERRIWLQPLDSKTGLASGPTRLVTNAPASLIRFSPNGKAILFRRVSDELGRPEPSTWWVVPSTGGPEREVPVPQGSIEVTWAANGASLLALTQGRLVRVSLDGRQIGEIENVSAVIVSGDGRRLLLSDPIPPADGLRRWTVADSAGRSQFSFLLKSNQRVLAWPDSATLLIDNSFADSQYSSVDIGSLYRSTPR
jgi:hypothetical protein